MDNELDVARHHQATYKSLVMEGKIMADIEMRPTFAIAPLSIAFRRLKATSDYTAMVRRTVEAHIQGHLLIDCILGTVVIVCIAYIAFATYSITQAHANIFSFVINSALAGFFCTLIIWGYLQRRYADHIRYMLFSDPAFFEKAMETTGSVRLFWIVSEQVAPREYTSKDFSVMSGLIQNEYVDFHLNSTSAMRTALKSDPQVVQQFKTASNTGYLFSSAAMDTNEREAYDPFSEGNDLEFEHNVMDLFTSNEDFFTRMHDRYRDSFMLTTGAGKSKRSIMYRA